MGPIHFHRWGEKGGQRWQNLSKLLGSQFSFLKSSRLSLRQAPRMPPKQSSKVSLDTRNSKKRKDPPEAIPTNQSNPSKGRHKRAKFVSELRSISTQNADAALKNGELDIQSFLKAREFEIKALENGMQEGKGALSLRAFQQVPRDMRRRTASHNVKRVPKRIRNRAKREMAQDNAPTVDPRKRPPRNSRGRIRAETAKRLGILAAKKKATKLEVGEEAASAGINTRPAKPKIRRDLLNDPPRPKSKFRKRQIHKTWLPTHLWHAKRAKMTDPKNPLWRFSIPITSTEKSYRPTHRAGGVRGAIAWDMSYISTIGLEGTVESLERVLKAMGVPQDLLGKSESKWKLGKRIWNGWLSRQVKDQRLQICPSTIVWCPPNGDIAVDLLPAKKKINRQLFIRVHPSAFLETWTELLCRSKLQRPAVHVIDLRFEIGSIDITGPGSTEALLGILRPHPDFSSSHSQTFTMLAGVTNPGSLPNGAILSFHITDPRLNYPPRPVQLPSTKDEEANFALLELLAKWPPDSSRGSSSIFDREDRFNATRLPSQKAINRRKALAPPGSHPSLVDKDPRIPVMLFPSRTRSATAAQGTWTLLAPWKCVLPIWYGLMHYPLSSGGNPRFGGLQELRQIHFEHGVPWFPADYPGAAAGFTWEIDERQKRKAEWERKPKGKRLEWDTLDLGAKRKGEIGLGWACDFERLWVSSPFVNDGGTHEDTEGTQKTSNDQAIKSSVLIEHLLMKPFTSLLSSADAELPSPSAVATVRLSCISRGVATPCARIYRLPSPSPSQKIPSPQQSSAGSNSVTSRERWLSLLPAMAGKRTPLPNLKSKKSKTKRIPLDVPLPQRVRLLAQSLLEPPLPYPSSKAEHDDYPVVPNEEDLIGFVTTGEFNLSEGKGIAIGSIVVKKVMEGLRRNGNVASKEGRLCIIRNAGEKLGRLAQWEPVW